MKRNNNRNLLGVITLIAICAFMLISCLQSPVTEALKPYKTLTLDIGGQQQKLYYGSNGAWYNALSEGGLLIDDNKVTGDNVKFNIPSAPTWTVTFKKNTPAGASDSEISISHESVVLTPELSLSDDSFIDKTTGKVSVDSIDGDKVVTGTYPPKAIGESVTASSTNSNYKFEKWTVKGVTIDNLVIHKVNGDTDIVANWKNLSDLKVLTVKDGDVVKDTVYYNLTDSKWYADENMTGERTSVIPPEVQEKTYTITIDSENDTPDDIRTVTSSFLGYGVGSEVKVQAGGLLSGYTINEDTELVFLWSEEKITEPSQQPIKDGFVFNGWYNGEKSYDFNSVVTGNITITAHWTKKTFNTLTLDIEGQKEQKLYYGSDSAWYKAVVGEEQLLIDDNKITGENVKFNIPSDPTWTVTFNKNTPAGAIDSEISITRESVVLTPELSLSPDNFIDKTSGQVLPGSISGHVTVTGTYPSKAIGEDVTVLSYNENYEFAGWTVKGVTIDNLADYEVSGNTEIVANWKNTSEFKILTVKDGESVKDTAYYNTTSNKWYKERSTTSEVKTSVVLPGNTIKTYTITLKYNDKVSEDRTSTLNSTFLGYGLSGADSANIPASGELANYTIENDTVLVSKWSEAKITKPENPTRDGYVFDKWTLNDTEYNFNNAVIEDITLVAVWTQKTYKTLTLNITDSNTQTLYYGSDNAWYKALGEGGLLIDDNKVTGDVKFNIPSAPTWTVTFDKNVPDGASESEFTITRESVVLKPELSLSPGDLIDNTGKVIPGSISGNVTVTGTYPSKVIVESVIASSTNPNYKFEKWTANGEDIDNIATYPVSGNITIKATWNNISNFKTLTVKDGDVVKDTAYYNATDNKWYVSNDITSELKTSVPTLSNREYTITLNYDNNGLNETRSEKVTSSFLGYGTNDNTSAVIGTDGSLSGYTIDKDTELVSLWSKEKFNKPAQPIKDGYVFNSWYNGDDTYSFDSVVTENMTLTAHWTKKTFKTLTLNITDSNTQTLYYGSDGAWYKALGEGDLLLVDNRVTGDNVKFNIPSAPKWTVTFNKNTPAGANADEIKISHESVEVTSELRLSPDNFIDKATGKVIPSSISENVTVTGTYPSKAIGESVTASSTNANYEFAGWTVNGVTISDIATCAVSGNITIKATWKNLSSFKVLTVKDGESVKDTAYYNTKDRKWYVSNDITSELKTSVPTLSNRDYTITLNYDNYGINETRSEKVTSSFLGYGTNDNTSAVIGTDGSLGDYSIDKDIELVSKWSEVKFPKPADPVRDGYVFDKWMLNGTEYIFDSVVTESITLVAMWTAKTYNTLTLNITGKEPQTLYYGSDNAWYKALSEDLLLDANKVIGEDVKFNIPSAPTWTVTFDKNTPDGAGESEFTLSTNTKTVTLDLTLTPADTVNAENGKVLLDSITENTIVTGTYPAKAIGESVTASSKNVNYEFDKWTAESGDEISDIALYKVSGNTTIKANWKNISSFKTLTVKDGESVKDTAYYNARDHKWYVNKDITSSVKASVNLPDNKTKNYTITLDYNNGSENGTSPLNSTFSGYGLSGADSANIPANGSLTGYTISTDTELVSLWNEVKYDQPANPERDGYVFDKWTKDGVEYNFDSVVTSDITITATWTKKTYKTLTLNITGKEPQTLYYGSDNAWYKALSDDLLLDANKVTGEDVKFNIPSAPVWTVTFDKNIPEGADESEFTLTANTKTVTPNLTLTPADKVNAENGKVILDSITENTTVEGSYLAKAIGESVTATSNDVNYEFDKWTAESGDEISDIALYKVSGNIRIKAIWKNISDFKVLTVKDGESVKDKVYYNLNEGKWYASADITGEVKTSVSIPENKEYTITLNYNNGSENGSSTLNSTFLGYRVPGTDDLKIQSDGLLGSYTIDKHTELVSKWSEVKFTKPANPERDGYVFDKWMLNDTEYNFNSVVTESITLVAMWTKKTYNTLTLNITGKDPQTLYYGSDSAWYKALSKDGLLLDANKVTGEDVKFNIPSAPVWTVTFDKNTPEGAEESDITLSPESLEVTDETGIVNIDRTDIVDQTGKVLVSSIQEIITVNVSYSGSCIIGQDVTVTTKSDLYKFNGWLDENGELIPDVANYVVSKNETLRVQWAYKVTLVEYGPEYCRLNAVIYDMVVEDKIEPENSYFVEGETVNVWIDYSGYLIADIETIEGEFYYGYYEPIQSSHEGKLIKYQVEMPAEPIRITFKGRPEGGW